MLSVASCANAQVMSAPRILLALARDGLLPSIFLRVNKGGSPYMGLVLTVLATAALTFTGSFEIAFGLVATLNAAASLMVIGAYFVLRRKAAELHRPFRAIAHPWLPMLGFVTSLAFFLLFLANNWIGGVYALALWLLCIPFALVARRMRAQPAGS
jgi:amino acid transporter